MDSALARSCFPHSNMLSFAKLGDNQNSSDRKDEMLSQLETGDIILFSGEGARSSLIKRSTRCPWSHVGMAIRLEGLDDLHLYESTSVGCLPDFHSGKLISGVQTVPLQERIRTYPGAVSARKLEERPSVEMLEALEIMHRQFRGRGYEVNDLELLKAAYDGPFGMNKRNSASIFCSELVAFAYQTMGYISRTLPANEYTPRDFSEAGNLTLLKGGLSREMTIK